MYNSRIPTVLKVLTAALLLSSAVFAQSQDRATIEKNIEFRRQLQGIGSFNEEKLRQLEDEFLSPAPEDRVQFAEFLGQPGTGIARLMPREKYRDKLSVREGGAYYSFTTLSNSYDSIPQISLEQSSLQTGFYGANFGFLASLGETLLESVTAEDPRVKYLAEFVAPTLEAEARKQYQRTSTGFAVGPTTYKNLMPVMVGGSYILRTINYDEADVLVAFRVVRQDTDGSLILLFKKLQEFPTPHLSQP